MAITRRPKNQAATDREVEQFVNAAPDGAKTGPRGVIRGRKRQITVTMDPGLIDRIDAVAARTGLSRTAIITEGAYRRCRDLEQIEE